MVLVGITMLMRLDRILDIACSIYLLIYLPAILPLVKADPSIWTIQIDESPAPSPEEGPPLSAHASRNKALIPAQVGGIIGAYALSVFVVGLALFLIGRRLRQTTQRSLKALDVEMIAPPFKPQQLYPSPVSPSESKSGARNFSWPSPEKDVRNPYIFPPATVEVGRPIEADHFVDRRVVEADRDLLARNLEDLYAHVMEQEEAKANGIILKAAPIPTHSRVGSQNSLPAEAPQRRNTLTQMARTKERPGKVDIELAKTETSRSRSARPGNIDIDLSRTEKTQSRTSSLISSLRLPLKKKGRELSISSPIPTPLSARFPGPATDEEREPLSPRIYSPPPPPPVPTDQAPYLPSCRTSNDPSPISPTRSIAEQLASSTMSSREPYHRYNPSATSIQFSSKHQSANSQTPLVSNTGAPSPRVLPFRAFETSSNTATSPVGSSMTKTTVLERNQSPLSPGLKTPWSAGAVPYSPYQPFSPIMPITPRLVTKEDRKRAKKAEGRGPATELIKSEEDLWDSGY